MDLAEIVRWFVVAVLLVAAVVLVVKGVRLMSRSGRSDVAEQFPGRDRLDVQGEGFRTLMLAAFAFVASAGVAVLPVLLA